MEADLSGIFVAVCRAISWPVLHAQGHHVVIGGFAYILQRCEFSANWNKGL